MGRLEERLRRLEDPRSPGRRKRDEEMKRRKREVSERINQQYAERAQAHPELYRDLLAANEQLHRDLKAAGIEDGEIPGPDELHRNPAADRALEHYMRESDRFWQGYSSGFSCEDCGRGAERAGTEPEGTCVHCGGITGNDYAFYKRIRPLEGLQADIDASKRMGHHALADRWERLLLRRLRDVGG